MNRDYRLHLARVCGRGPGVALLRPRPGPAVAAAAAPAAAAPRGSLLIVGGGPIPDAILERFVALAGGRGRARIVIFPMASEYPDAGLELAEDFRKLRRRGRADRPHERTGGRRRRRPAPGRGDGDLVRGRRPVETDRGARAHARRDRDSRTLSRRSGRGRDLRRSRGHVHAHADGRRTPAGRRPASREGLERRLHDDRPGQRRHDRRLRAAPGRRSSTSTTCVGAGTTAFSRSCSSTRTSWASGIDESTALEVGPSGPWRILGTSVAVVYDARQARITPPSGAPLGATGIRLAVLPAGQHVRPGERGGGAAVAKRVRDPSLRSG